MQRYWILIAMIAAVAVMTGAAVEQDDSGRKVYQGKGNCFTCHGGDGQGSVLGPDLRDDVWVNFDQRPTPVELEALIRSGVPKPLRHPAPMPPMGGGRLTDEDVSQVAAYVLSLSEGTRTTGSRS
jgi:cytochrome c oxidase cbb3-type subunit III